MQSSRFKQKIIKKTENAERNQSISGAHLLGQFRKNCILKSKQLKIRIENILSFSFFTRNQLMIAKYFPEPQLARRRITVWIDIGKALVCLSVLSESCLLGRSSYLLLYYWHCLDRDSILINCAFFAQNWLKKRGLKLIIIIISIYLFCLPDDCFVRLWNETYFNQNIFILARARSTPLAKLYFKILQNEWGD